MFSIQLPSTTHLEEDSQWDGEGAVSGQQEEGDEQDAEVCLPVTVLGG